MSARPKGTLMKQNAKKPKLYMIRIKGYPCILDFVIEGPLPKFKYGCPTRTQILHEMLEGEKYDAPHMPSDFIVESVSKFGKNGEIWGIGS